LQYIGTMHTTDETPVHSWRRAQIIWEHVGNTRPADKYANSIDIANITGGNIDSSWTDSDYSTVHTQVSSIISYYLTVMSTDMRCAEVRYYRRQFNPMNITQPFAPTGPPEKIFLVGQSGSGTAQPSTPPQCAVTHTEKTAYPRHWGRSYWPCPASAHITAGGYLSNGITDGLANAIGTAYRLMQEAEFFPVVPVTQVQGAPSRGLLGVTQVQVDNVPDVVRRRRPSVKTHAALSPA